LFCHGIRVLVILGDNIFLDSLHDFLSASQQKPDHAWVMLKQVADPQRYGVAELKDDRVVGLEEKPAQPKSDYAVAGIYLYPPDVFNIVKGLRPSGRGELEITDVNLHYLSEGRLGYSILNGYWTDAGTPESLALVNQLVHETMPV